MAKRKQTMPRGKPTIVVPQIDIKLDLSPEAGKPVDDMTLADARQMIEALQAELRNVKMAHGREISENVELRRTMRAMARQLEGCSRSPADNQCKYEHREFLKAFALQLRAVAEFGEIPF